MDIKGNNQRQTKRRQTNKKTSQSNKRRDYPASRKQQLNKNQSSNADKQSPKLEVSVSLPSLSWLKWSNLLNHLRKLSIRQKAMISGAILIFMAIGSLTILGPFSESSDEPTSDANGSVASSQLSQLERGTPEYTTLTPDGQDDNDIEWFRVSPKGTDPVYVFVDAINGTPIRVSQQQLPSDFQKNTASELERTARESGVLEKITVDGDTAYIGAVADGRRSIILIRNNLLVLIDAAEGLSTSQLTSYISSLE